MNKGNDAGNSAFSHANTDIPSSQITTILCEDEESLASALMLYLEGKARHFKCLKDFMESPQLKQLNPGLFIIDLCNPDDPEGHGTIELLPELRRLFSESRTCRIIWCQRSRRHEGHT